MLPKDYSEPIVRVVADCHDLLLQNIARHFNVSATGATPTFEWEVRKLAELGQLTRENIKIIADTVSPGVPMVQTAIEQAMRDAIEKFEPALKRAALRGLLSKATPGLSPAMRQILRNYSLQAVSQLNLVNTVMLKSSLEMFRRVVANTVAYERQLAAAQSILNTATGEVVTGVSSRTAALRKAIQQMAQEGLYGFTDIGGHHWTPEAYINMDMRTTAGNVAREAVFQRNAEYGNDLVIVRVNATARPKCYPWQGKVISTSNRSGYTYDLYSNQIPITPVRQTSYGEPDGLWGINCHHSPPDPFIPGISTQRDAPPPQAENDTLYKQSQVQRGKETAVRDAKREALVAQASGDQEAFAKAAQKVKAKQSDLKHFVASTGGTLRSDRTQVVGYTKSVSGKATAAIRQTNTVLLSKQNEIRALIKSDNTPKTLNIGNQNKHILGSKGYIEGRSYIYGTLDDAQRFVDQYHGTGESLFDRKGNWKNREIVAIERDIGVCLDIDGASEITNAFTIHYGKKGTHIVPAARRDYR